MPTSTKVLCVFDGFGLSPNSPNNCAAISQMPNFRRLLKDYWWSTLAADGEKVGQEDGLVGNSEVGHMNIGGLKLVPQLSYQITNSSGYNYDLNQEVNPDQLFDPKDFLKKKWLKKDITILDLERINDGVANLILEAYRIVCEYEQDWGTGGETIRQIPNSQLTVEDFFDHLITWYTLSDLSDKTVNEIANQGFNPKVFTKVFDKLSQAYQVTGTTNPVGLIDSLNFVPPAKTIHLIGLFSKGKIHSDLRHWAGAINAAGISGATKIVMHLISDGRDSDRQSLVETWNYFICAFDQQIGAYKDKICLGSFAGRFYAMDRDSNWERTFVYLETILDQRQATNEKLLSYPPLTKFVDIKNELSDVRFDKIYKKYNIQKAEFTDSQKEVTNQSFKNLDFDLRYDDLTVTDLYKLGNPDADLFKDGLAPYDRIKGLLETFTKILYPMGIYDEHIEPKQAKGLSKDDTIWLINFRTDRMKQLSQMLCDINTEFQLNLTIISNNSYGIKLETFLTHELEFDSVRNRFHNLPNYNYQPGLYYPIFKTQSVQGTLAQTISGLGKTQLHIAETEKYNHVTYFLNGGADRKWPGEDWMVIPSNKVNSHAEMPPMKAAEVTDYILDSGLGKYDYIVVNYANPDMLGHTGNIEASVESMEALDLELGKLIEVIKKEGHQMIIIADHGNIEIVGENEQNGKTLIDTEHNASPVPFIIVSSKFKNDNSDLEINKAALIQKMQELSDQNITRIDIDKLKTVLTQNNQADLAQEWLTKEQIPASILPLWYSGAVLLGL